jgi:hypothetical protein
VIADMNRPSLFGEKRRKLIKDWLRVLPWDLIYALGVAALVISLTLVVSLIAHLS